NDVTVGGKRLRHLRTDQDLVGPGGGTKSRGEIHHLTDGRIALHRSIAAEKTDMSIAAGHTNTNSKGRAQQLDVLGAPLDPMPYFQGRVRDASDVIRAPHRSVGESEHAVSEKLVDGDV